ncbi:hypothetical protein ACFLSX_03400 [Calditrichota bacterium]
MKRFLALTIILLIIPFILFAQLKKDLKQPDFSNILVNPANQYSLFSFIDPSKLTMSHSASMSYTSMGGQSIVMNSYVNTIDYQFNDQLSMRTNLGIMASPYNSLPNNSYLNEQQFFGGAELNYRPSENTLLSLKFESLPAYYYRPSIWDSRRFNSSFGEW